jgi:hypothetical protein
MRISLNDVDIEIKNSNTDFTDYWMSTVFKSTDQVLADVNNDYLLSLKQQYDAAWNKLRSLLDTVNELIVKHQLDNSLIYRIENTPSTRFLELTHEQWAAFSSEALEKHNNNIYNPDTNEIYYLLNDDLKNKNTSTDHINNMVHTLENIYRYSAIHNIRLSSVNFVYNDYKVKPSDTIFGHDSLVVPFRDIGRPQYEKWSISGHVSHNEISNYDRITNYIDFYFCAPSRIVPNRRFIRQCKTEDVPAWGNMLSIGTAKYHNFDDVGYLFVNALTTNNYLSIKK